MVDKLASTPLAQIDKDPQLLDFARAYGRAVFVDNCAPCHGAGGGGAKGYPNLNDDDWLWGGKLADIEQTIPTAPAPATTKAARGNMPPFAGVLKPNEISAVADYVRSLSGLPTEKGADLAIGKKVFADNCAVCHGPDGKGNRELGSANLTDKIWLYGPDKETIMEGVTKRARRRDAGLGRTAERADHQGACGLCPYARRRREVIVQAVRTLSLDQGARGARPGATGSVG